MNHYITESQKSSNVLGSGLQRYMIKVYGHVALALLITAIGSLITLTFEPLHHLLFRFDSFGGFCGHTMLGGCLSFSPFVIAFYLSAQVERISFTRSRLLFCMYALLTGVSLACLAFYYTIDSLHKTFLITSITFGCMSLFGYVTNRDLTSVGSFCSMAIWGIIISSIINIFWRSEAMDFITSFIGVITFTALIAYHAQRLKVLYYEMQGTALSEKVALMAAFSLYINFLNLFVYLLRFFGERKRK